MEVLPLENNILIFVQHLKRDFRKLIPKTLRVLTNKIVWLLRRRQAPGERTFLGKLLKLVGLPSVHLLTFLRHRICLLKPIYLLNTLTS